ncbi:MAG: hypothetical protein WCW26_04810 [Candidatus Buchananbacteria bacterium]
MKKIIISQFIVLLAGTLFAWGNFSWELINYLNQKTCAFACTTKLVNPFFTPCFYGAIFFTLAFILSIFLVRGRKTS